MKLELYYSPKQEKITVEQDNITLLTVDVPHEDHSELEENLKANLIGCESGLDCLAASYVTLYGYLERKNKLPEELKFKGCGFRGMINVGYIFNIPEI